MNFKLNTWMLLFFSFLILQCSPPLENPNKPNVKLPKATKNSQQALETIDIEKDIYTWRNKEYDNFSALRKDFSQLHSSGDLKSSDILLNAEKNTSFEKIIPVVELMQKLDLEIILETEE